MENINGQTILVKTIFGSHLYGTNNEGSDTDYKGVFMPTKEQIYLGKIPKSITVNTKTGDGKNTNTDVDIEFYSLHYFIHLACEGETVALDMLHAPKWALCIETSEWDRIIANRHLFYTRNLKAFVGYARKQASKYGIRGSRLNAAKDVLEFCKSTNPELRVRNVWESLPIGEHIYKHEPDDKGIRMYEVCGRKIGDTTTVGFLNDTIQHFYNNYGARAEQAANNEGIDWKAVSHAIRAAYQVKQILTEGTVTFPLREALYIRNVKEGKFNYRDEVAPVLEELMDEVELLSKNSILPDTVNRKFWDNFLMEEVERYLGSVDYSE
jgi:hypothetical protein